MSGKRYAGFFLRFAMILFLFSISACSNSEDKEKVSVASKTSDKIAQEAISNIRTPIEKANMAKDQTEDHNMSLKEAAKQD